MRRTALALAIVLGALVVRAEELVTVKPGTMQGSGGDAYDTLPVAITNHSDKVFKYVRVECGFFRGDQLIGAEKTWVENVKPKQTAYVSALHYNTQKVRSDHGDCRVISVEEEHE
jgi:hypothetical protein